MTRVEKKAWPDLFEQVLNGSKAFDLRLADFDIKEGDTLLLEEWDSQKKEYTLEVGCQIQRLQKKRRWRIKKC